MSHGSYETARTGCGCEPCRTTRDTIGWRYCPRCARDTLPLNSGRCAFCDTVIDAPSPSKPVARCEECGDEFPVARWGSHRKYCSDKCKTAVHRRSPAWAASQARKLERRKARYRAAREAGYSSAEATLLSSRSGIAA